MSDFLRLQKIMHFGILAFTCVGIGAHAAPPDAHALLRQSDSYRNGWPSFVMRVKIVDYEAGRPDEEHLYEVSEKGADKTYVEFLSPREKGEHLLMLGDEMWIYLPDASWCAGAWAMPSPRPACSIRRAWPRIRATG